MKKIVILLMVFISLGLSAQNDVLVIYVDASASGDKLIQIQEEVNSLVDSKANARVYLFISNGNSPYVTSERGDVKRVLRKLRTRYITAPDYTKDVRSINRALLDSKYISDLNNISQSSGLNYQLDIHLWLDEGNFNDLKLEKRIINPILFSNKLKFENGEQENCSVTTHF